MTNRKRKAALISIGLLAVLVAGTLLRSAYRRSAQPQFEGKTADEWLEYFERRVDSTRPYLHNEKEAAVVFRSLGAAIQSELVREILFGERPPRTPTWESLYRRTEKLPAFLRFKFLRDPANHRVVISAVIRRARPDWEAFAPHVERTMAGTNAHRFNVLLNLLGEVGNGASNALPCLMAGLTSTNTASQRLAIQSLSRLGRNAAPALPLVLNDLNGDRWHFRHLWILGNLGPLAREAVPKLESLLEQAIAPTDFADIAVTILRIDPDNQPALKRLLELFESNDPHSRKVAETLRLSYPSPEPNPAFEQVIRLQIAISRNPGGGPIDALYQYRPAEALARARKHFSPEDSNYLFLLLRLDPFDASALSVISNKIHSPLYLNNVSRTAWLNALACCYSDSPGVTSLLNAAASKETLPLAKQTIARVRREIELNDHLRRLNKAIKEPQPE